MSSSFMRRLVPEQEVEDDTVIDLTDRLAPYRGAVVRPVRRTTPLLEETSDPELWTPLDLDFLFGASRPSR